MKCRRSVFLTGAALTGQWLILKSGPLVSGLAGRRVLAMIYELRPMDDVSGGGIVLSLVEQ